MIPQNQSGGSPYLPYERAFIGCAFALAIIYVLQLILSYTSRGFDMDTLVGTIFLLFFLSGFYGWVTAVIEKNTSSKIAGAIWFIVALFILHIFLSYKWGYLVPDITPSTFNKIMSESAKAARAGKEYHVPEVRLYPAFAPLAELAVLIIFGFRFIAPTVSGSNITNSFPSYAPDYSGYSSYSTGGRPGTFSTPARYESTQPIQYNGPTFSDVALAWTLSSALDNYNNAKRETSHKAYNGDNSFDPLDLCDEGECYHDHHDECDE